MNLKDIINKIILGDCLEILLDVPNNSFDLIIIDPPYFLPATHYQTRTRFRRSFADLGILEHFFKEVFEQIKRTLKSTGFFYVFCDGQSYPLFYYYSYFFTKSVRPIIWDKTVSISGYSWRHQHEIIIFGVMPKSPAIKTGDGDIINDCRAVPIDRRKHPAEKPEELIEKLILKSSQLGDLVADFFMGSGTTCVVAKKLRRKYFGIDIGSEYYEIAKKRIESVNMYKNISNFTRKPNQKELTQFI